MITPAHGDGKGRREYAYTPERPSAVFLLGCTRHRNGDRGCEPFHLNVVARMDASSVYRAQKPRHGRPMAGFCLPPSSVPADTQRVKESPGRAGAASRENVSPLPNVSNVYLTYLKYLMYLMVSRGSAQIREDRVSAPPAKGWEGALAKICSP